MRRYLLLAVSLACLPPVQPIEAAEGGDKAKGPYIYLGGGYDLLQDEHAHAAPGLETDGRTRYRFGTGYESLGAVGYQTQAGLRLEVEGGYRGNNVAAHVHTTDSGTATGRQNEYTAMFNVLYELDLKKHKLAEAPIGVYVGTGLGYAWTRASPFTDVYDNGAGTLRVGGTGGDFAFQGIFGVSYDVDALPGLAVFAEYRLFSTLNEPAFKGERFSPTRVSKGNVDLDQNFDHDFLIGLRYTLDSRRGGKHASSAPASNAEPPLRQARSFLVFFDWDRADLTDRARQVVAEAAKASKQGSVTRIEVDGYSDLSGPAPFNQALSLRRARAVQAELARDGVPAGVMEVRGRGIAAPLVPTEPGVREAQNRRVEIVLH